MQSILASIKKLLGPGSEHTYFDADLIMHINSVFMVLTQLGLGPPEGFTISDDSAAWSDFIPEDSKHFEAVRTYVYLQTKLVFDPPASSAVLASIERKSSELEWRLNHAAEM